MKIFPKQTLLLLVFLLTGFCGMGQNTNPAPSTDQKKPKKVLVVSSEPDYAQIAKEAEAALQNTIPEIAALRDKYDPNKAPAEEPVPQEILDMLNSYGRLIEVTRQIENLSDQQANNSGQTKPTDPSTTTETNAWDLDELFKNNKDATKQGEADLQALRDKYNSNKKPKEDPVPQDIIHMFDSYGRLAKVNDALTKLLDQNANNAVTTNPPSEKATEPEKKNPSDEQLVIKPTGTGQTTGHVADLNVKNKLNTPIPIIAQIVYIPSDGKYQPYVVTIPASTIPPKSELIIPIYGYCADVHTPPVPPGETMPPVSTWIALETTTPVTTNTPVAIVQQTVPPFLPFDIPAVISSPGFVSKPEPVTPYIPIDPTWPGTDTPLSGTVDPVNHPETFAPIIINALQNITVAYDKLKNENKIITPFSGAPEKERESVIQQTFWIYMSAITGEDYLRNDFEAKVNQQFEEKTGMSVINLPEPEKEKLQTGVDQFWVVFTATGIEAKVLSEPSHTTETTGEVPSSSVPPALIKVGGCTLEEKVTDSGPKLDYAIAETGTKGKNEKVKEAFKKAIQEAAGIASSGEGSDTVDISFTGPQMPASAWSLYFPHVVAGQANASAFVVDMKDPANSAWTTQPLQTKADGSREVVLTHHMDANCKSTLIGINFAKVRASSGLKASLGNIEALRVINFVGEIAIDIVIQRGKGTYTKLSKYLAEKTKDMAKDAAKEFIKEQLAKFNKDWKDKTDEQAEQSMDELLKEIKEGDQPSDPAEDAGEFLDDWLAEMLVEGDGFDPAEKIEGDLLDKIDSPIDWAPIKTNTYAIGEGSLDVYVDGDHGLAKAASGVRYKRVELEDAKEAEKGGGIFCDEGIASHTTSGTITLKTVGKTGSWCAATGEGIISTGHGIAIASLESFNGMYVIAICDCPSGISYDTYSSITAYSTDDIMVGIWTSMFERMMNDVADQLDKDIAAALSKGLGLPANTAEGVQKSLENAAAQAAQSILPCGSKK